MIWVRDYDNFMECEYLIFTLDPSSTISLLIQDIDIEYSRGCIYDSLMVSRLLFSSAEMFKKPLWQAVWTQIRLLL